MKTPVNAKYTNQFLNFCLLFIILIVLQGCNLMSHGIKEEYDEVKSITRITKSFFPREAEKFFSPLELVQQTIL